MVKEGKMLFFLSSSLSKVNLAKIVSSLLPELLNSKQSAS